MYAVYNNSLKDKHWKVVNNLNTDLKAKIKTNYGPTRTISITVSIRQGRVLSVVLFGLLMDNISHEVAAEELGFAIEGTYLIISNLLWVDDVVIVETNPHNMLRILYLVNHIAKKYHLEFGEVKSKVLKIGKGPGRINFKLGNMKLQYVEKYKYLGYTQNNTNTIQDHLNSLKGKVEAAYQKTLALPSNPTLKWIEMEMIWTIVETCILPIITYAGEIFIIRNKKEEAAIKIL